MWKGVVIMDHKKCRFCDMSIPANMRESFLGDICCFLSYDEKIDAYLYHIDNGIDLILFCPKCGREL